MALLAVGDALLKLLLCGEGKDARIDFVLSLVLGERAFLNVLCFLCLALVPDLLQRLRDPKHGWRPRERLEREVRVSPRGLEVRERRSRGE